PVLRIRSPVYVQSYTRRAGETKQPSAITPEDVKKRIATGNQRSQFAVTDGALDHGRNGADHALQLHEGTRILEEDLPMSNGTTSGILRGRVFPAYWRVPFAPPPLNIFGPETIPQLNEIITALETDEQVKVVVFDSAVDGFFLTHYDFLAKPEDTTRLP